MLRLEVERDFGASESTGGRSSAVGVSPQVGRSILHMARVLAFQFN